MGIARIVLTGIFRGVTMQNVLHFDNHSSGVLPLTHCDTIKVQWLSEYKFFSSNQFAWTDIAYTQLTPTLGITAHLTVNIPGTSNATADTDNPVLCEKIKLLTDTPGRRGRGRIYAPAASLAGANVGLVKPETIAARQTRLDTLLARFGGGAPPTGLTFGICSRQNPADFKPVTAMQLAITYGVQRRRQYFVGV